MRMIMLGGKARVGKTTIAEVISEISYHKGFKPVILPFASSVKKEAEDLGYSKKHNPDEYRKHCQKIGSARRKEDPDYWINIWSESVRDVIKQETKAIENNEKYWERVVLVDDCRYMNEVAIGREYDSTQIFVSNGTRSIEDEHAEWRVHESELLANNVEAGDPNYTDLFPITLINDGTLKDLKDVLAVYTEVWLGLRVLNGDNNSKVLKLSQSEMRIAYVSQLMDELLDQLGFTDDEDEEDDIDE